MRWDWDQEKVRIEDYWSTLTPLIRNTLGIFKRVKYSRDERCIENVNSKTFAITAYHLGQS
jgi:hypothetical protein